jgi:predicted nucleic acid-binding protein
VEVLSAVRGVVAAGDASEARGEEAVTDLLDLPIQRYPHEGLVPRIWQLRTNFAAYDSTYLALAEAVAEGGAPLLTADRHLARATSAHTDIQVVLAA